MSTDGPLVVGLVHTVPALAGTFEHLLYSAAPSVRTVHVADAWLLRTAIDAGVDERVHHRVAVHVAHLARAGARAVLITCSSIGETAAGAAERAGVPVVRVDEPMAHDAVGLAGAAGRAAGRPGRVAVLATLSSTLGPTGRLVDGAVTRSGERVTVAATVVEGAAAARAAGDQADHDARVRAAVVRAAEASDVVVLAQASMAAALDGDTDGTPVLSSPVGGVGALLETARSTQ